MISKFTLNYSLILKLYLQNKQDDLESFVDKSLFQIQLNVLEIDLKIIKIDWNSAW